MWIRLLLTAICLTGGALWGEEMITVTPTEYPHAFGNPMKGFRVSATSVSHKHEYATLAQCYIRWNELENDESDSIEKIRTFCDGKWKMPTEYGLRIIPRVYLDWDRKEGNEYWPADMQTGDYTSEQFQKRIRRLVERLAECWDDDPQVAWIQMGLIGFWGEHHSPSPTPEMQKLLGDAFTELFPHKMTVVRHADEFTDYTFGMYWDSWAHVQQINGKKHGGGLLELNRTKKRWQVRPIEGETAYNWGKYQIQPGDNPNDTLSDPVHRDFLIDSIRQLHCTALGWVAAYDASISEVRAGAEEVQKAFGYRFVLKEFTVPRRWEPGKSVPVTFSVVNVGSAPFYENWPVEVSLLDVQTREPVWKTTLADVDIRKWLPGDEWNSEKDVYEIPAETFTVKTEVTLPKIPVGEYIVAISVLEPVGNRPSLRFAIPNYFAGGRHPLCRVGVGTEISGDGQLDPTHFDDLRKEIRVPSTLIPRENNP